MNWKKFLLLALAPVMLYPVLLLSPSLLFAEHRQYRGFNIHSDEPIPDAITTVIDDAIMRLEKSELYKENDQFDVYLCNADWRYGFFTRSPNSGGLVNFVISPNIFLRQSNIESNTIIPPPSWKNSLEDRPLSYFLAHESVHVLQRNFDAFLIFNTPIEIVEGYAEYIAKSSSNDMEKLISQYRDGRPTMDPANGLYDKYNLYVSYLVEVKNYDFAKLVETSPDMQEVLNELRSK